MQKTLAELLTELETAVRAGNRTRAEQLQQLILQRLATESADRTAMEMRVRELMQQLTHPQSKPSVPESPTFGTKGIITRGDTSPTPTGGTVYPVWFGTNRKPQNDGFTGERHKYLTRGRVDVHVPEAHRFGETGNPFWKRLLRFDLRDDHLSIQKRIKLERDPFYAEIHARLAEARTEGEAAHALFFIHGYKNTFEEAAIRAAQIGYDLKAAATAFFSWPSKGVLEGYPADEASIEASERHITDFLVEFSANCGADKLHVIAHSMGNRGLLRALQRIAANAATQGKVKFGQIFLAAPDVDSDLFRDLAYLYRQFAERATLYASRGDWPVWLSDKYHAAPRVGYFPPYTVAKDLVDTIAVPDFNVDLLGHSYFAQAEALLYDIYGLMRADKNPAQRPRIEPDFDGETSFWKLNR